MMWDGVGCMGCVGAWSFKIPLNVLARKLILTSSLEHSYGRTRNGQILI